VIQSIEATAKKLKSQHGQILPVIKPGLRIRICYNRKHLKTFLDPDPKAKNAAICKKKKYKIVSGNLKQIQG